MSQPRGFLEAHCGMSARKSEMHQTKANPATIVSDSVIEPNATSPPKKKLHCGEGVAVELPRQQRSSDEGGLETIGPDFSGVKGQVVAILWSMATPPWLRTIYGLLGLGALGGTTFVILKASGVLEVSRGEGDSFIMDTFTMTTTKKQFVASVMDAARQADPSLSREPLIMLAAWAAYESGWGKTPQAQRAFNVFNLTAGSSWPAEMTMDGTDTEYTPGQQGAKKITQKWRKYASLADQLRDLLGNFLVNTRWVNYRQALAELKAGDVRAFTTLGVNEVDPADPKRVVRVAPPDWGGYYTLARSKYQASMNKLVAEVRAIVDQLDRENAGVSLASGAVRIG